LHKINKNQLPSTKQKLTWQRDSPQLPSSFSC
jgi:hypothetical protein